MDKIEEIKKQIAERVCICGISSDEVQLAKSLVDNKNKDESLFVCEDLWAGDKLMQKNIEVPLFVFCEEILKSDKISSEEFEKILRIVKYAKKSCIVSAKACKKISDRDGFDQFFIIAKMPKYTFSDIKRYIAVNNNVMAIVMDGLEQPGNIGAILRSCDCAGADFAVITNRKARLTNSRLIRSSLGAAYMIPVVEAEIGETQQWLEANNFRCLVTDLQAKKSFKDADYDGRIAIVAGNEHTGISDSWRHLKNSESIIIPMYGSCESLNVGFASTLVAYEAGIRKFDGSKNKF